MGIDINDTNFHSKTVELLNQNKFSKVNGSFGDGVLTLTAVRTIVDDDFIA